MSDPKHSPIPWTTSDPWPAVILDSKGSYVGQCKTPDIAATIVRAVNSLEELREAIASLVNEIEFLDLSYSSLNVANQRAQQSLKNSDL